MIVAKNISGGYNGKSIVQDVSFEVEKGQLFGILGPNGSGKTTLLKMLSGILSFHNGSIYIKGKPITAYSTKELAKIVAVLPQHTTQAFTYTVKETVSLGRYPHQRSWFQTWSAEDEQIVNTVMEQTGIIRYQDQFIQELSGGERQRVFLAQALAQEPEILLLDEPTNHLDLSFQKELLDLLKKWTIERQLTVISIFHDLNLAGLYCDQLLLLDHGKININDKPNEVLKQDRIEEVYQTLIEKKSHPRVPKPQLLLMPDLLDHDCDIHIIDERLLVVSDEWIELTAPIALRTMSSGVVGSGTGWHHQFVNRHVSKDYDCADYQLDMEAFLQKNGFDLSDTVGMMTAVMLENVSYQFLTGEGFSALIVVTAGVGNAVDASRCAEHVFEMTPGTINTWIFVNGDLSEEAFIQSIMTATEAKVKALHDLEVYDPITKTLATGTSTDSILIAATQRGMQLTFAGTITPLGKLIGQGVYECTCNAIKKSRSRFMS